MQDKIDEFKKKQKLLNAYNYATWLMNWDQNTQTPVDSLPYKSEQIVVLTNQKLLIETSDEYLGLFRELYENRDKLKPELKRETELLYRDLRLVLQVPNESYIDHQVLKTTSLAVWQKAMQNDDFGLFLPVLVQMVDFNIKALDSMETADLQGYDILLDDYEEGMTASKYDEFFSELKNELVTFVMHSTTRNKRKFSRRLTHNVFPIEQQKEFVKYLLTELGFDYSRGAVKESLSSYTTSVSSFDVRIGIYYDEENLKSSIFGALHEFGHALYLQQINPQFNGTRLFNDSSKALHESQSRLFENMIGRSKNFWKRHYPKLSELFPKQLRNIDVDEFYDYVNYAERSVNRANADELTYPLHVVARYELEKDLLSGRLKPKDLPNRFKALMSQYVGKRPVKDGDGILQDIHWAKGAFGYFPTYVLGSAIAAQLYRTMNKKIGIDKLVSTGNYKAINDWLKENIHKYGSLVTAQEILVRVTGEEINPRYYLNYLKDKFKYE